MPAGPIPGELIADPAAARAPLHCPLQRFFLDFFLENGNPETLEPLADDVEILVLV